MPCYLDRGFCLQLLPSPDLSTRQTSGLARFGRFRRRTLNDTAAFAHAARRRFCRARTARLPQLAHRLHRLLVYHRNPSASAHAHPRHSPRVHSDRWHRENNAEQAGSLPPPIGSRRASPSPTAGDARTRRLLRLHLFSQTVWLIGTVLQPIARLLWFLCMFLHSVCGPLKQNRHLPHARTPTGAFLRALAKACARIALSRRVAGSRVCAVARTCWRGIAAS